MEQKKQFDGTEGGFIEVDKSNKMVAAFHKKNPDHKIQAHFFGCDVIRDILEEPGCKGIRIYYALGEDESPQLILVGADENMDNILHRKPVGKSLGAAAGGGMSGTADESFPCPTYCPKNGLG